MNLPLVIIRPDAIVFHNVEILLAADGKYQFVSVGESEVLTEPLLANSPLYNRDDRVLRIPLVVSQSDNNRFVNVEVLLNGKGFSKFWLQQNSSSRQIWKP